MPTATNYQGQCFGNVHEPFRLKSTRALLTLATRAPQTLVAVIMSCSPRSLLRTKQMRDRNALCEWKLISQTTHKALAYPPC